MTAPGEFVPGYIVTATDMNDLPAGVLGYAEVTADQTGIGTESAIIGLSVTVDLPAGRRIKVTGHGTVRIVASGETVIGDIQEDTVDVARWAQFHSHVANEDALFDSSVILTPTSGSHTYRLTLRLGSGSGSVELRAASGVPAFILVEDVGSA